MVELGVTDPKTLLNAGLSPSYYLSNHRRYDQIRKCPSFKVPTVDCSLFILVLRRSITYPCLSAKLLLTILLGQVQWGTLSVARSTLKHVIAIHLGITQWHFTALLSAVVVHGFCFTQLLLIKLVKC
jgi:hypothetical protein